MAVPKRFGVLRLVGTLLKVLAWIIFVLAIVLGIIAGALSSVPPLVSFIDSLPIPGLSDLLADGSGLVVGIVLFLSGLLSWLLLYSAGENLLLRVAVEENTRLTAALLLRMHQDSQVEADANYAAGYTGEPYAR